MWLNLYCSLNLSQSCALGENSAQCFASKNILLTVTQKEESHFQLHKSLLKKGPADIGATLIDGILLSVLFQIIYSIANWFQNGREQ